MTSSIAATERITRVVEEHIPNGKMVQDVGSDLVFCLPEFDEGGTRQREKFPALFDELDAKTNELGLDSYGVSDTTLEEVRSSFYLIFHLSERLWFPFYRYLLINEMSFFRFFSRLRMTHQRIILPVHLLILTLLVSKRIFYPFVWREPVCRFCFVEL